MKSLLLLLLLTTNLISQAQEQALTESEKAKLLTYWRQHWPEKVKVEVLKEYKTVAMVRLTNNLPYNISKYHLNIQWYDAKGKVMNTPYKDGGKLVSPYNVLEGYMQANTSEEIGFPTVPGAVSVKVSVGFVELPKIGMKQEVL